MSLLSNLAQKIGILTAKTTTRPKLGELGLVVRSLREKVENRQLNILLEGAIAGMPTEREVVVYAKGGDSYLGRQGVRSVDFWRRFGRQRDYKYLYKGFAYYGNERIQVVVFDDKVWDSQEIQKRKANGFLGIRFYDLISGEERQITELRDMPFGAKTKLVKKQAEGINSMRKLGEQSGDHEDFGVNDLVKVRFDVLRKKKGLLPPYENLVRTILNHGGGSARIISIKDDEAEIIGNEKDKYLGSVKVPLSALRKVRAFVAGGGQIGGATIH